MNVPWQEWELRVDSEAAMDLFGAALAAVLPCPALVALCGTLGAGKTRLVQALAAAAGVPREEVVSPTFILCQQYQGRTPMYHLDAYRIADDEEWFELGVSEMLAEPAWMVIEWADRFTHLLPAEQLRIDLHVEGTTERRLVITACGSPYLESSAQLRAEYAGTLPATE